MVHDGNKRSAQRKNEWRNGMIWDKLIGEMNSAIRYPGILNIWRIPIPRCTEMFANGIRLALGFKNFGPDLGVIERMRVGIERALLDDAGTALCTRSAFTARRRGRAE